MLGEDASSGCAYGKLAQEEIIQELEKLTNEHKLKWEKSYGDKWSCDYKGEYYMIQSVFDWSMCIRDVHFVLAPSIWSRRGRRAASLIRKITGRIIL